jgi:hypothetical protein
MPIGLNSLELLKYFRLPESAFGKSIQRSWQFYGFFIYNPLSTKSSVAAQFGNTFGVSTLMKSLNKDFPPIIQPYHIIDVNIPTYKFKRMNQMYGQVPRSFPLLEFEGFNFSITLEEDERGTVEYFINWLQRRIISSEGYYNAPELAKIPAFVLEVQDKTGVPVVYYMFHDIYYLEAGDVQYSYTSNESIRRSITFGCDRLNTTFIKQNAVATAIGLAQATGGISKLQNEFDEKLNRVKKIIKR